MGCTTQRVTISTGVYNWTVTNQTGGLINGEPIHRVYYSTGDHLNGRLQFNKIYKPSGIQ